MSKLFKVTRQLRGHDERGTWSVGYPTLSAARAAARRLNQTSAEAAFRAAPMEPADYDILKDQEGL